MNASTTNLLTLEIGAYSRVMTNEMQEVTMLKVTNNAGYVEILSVHSTREAAIEIANRYNDDLTQGDIEAGNHYWVETWVVK